MICLGNASDRGTIGDWPCDHGRAWSVDQGDIEEGMNDYFTNIWYTPKRFGRFTVWRSYDIGTLTLGATRAEYRGERHHFTLERIRAVNHIRMAGDLNNNWVQVEYGDSAEPEMAFFADGKQLGIGNLRGGSEALFRALRVCVDNQSSGSMPHGSDAPAWDTGVLRELLTAAFSDEDLTALCYDNFLPVYEDFSIGMSKGVKIQRLLDYCMREHRLDQLVQIIEA
jgi:hypothetical protein